MFVKQYSNHKNQLALVILKGNLSDNEKAKDAIPGGHPETDTCLVDLAVVFLSLFISYCRGHKYIV